MAIKVAINGFGRIGKNFFHAVMQDPQARKHLVISAINIGTGNIASVPYLIKYDTLLGSVDWPMQLEGNILTVQDQRITLLAETDPAKINWQDLHIDWVVEATGKFTKAADARKHILSGACKVLITAPAEGEDITVLPGINCNAYKSEHAIVSLGSCTTNAVAPMVKILDETFGIENAVFTTVHAYTNSQALLDVERRDLRDSRAAAVNIIPSSTGANKVVTKVLPHLTGKIKGMSLRVPVAKVSIIDLVCTLNQQTTAVEINDTFTAAARSSLAGYIQVCAEPLVSSDFYRNSNSVIIDAQLTQVQGNVCKVFGWYDNEWGYSERLKDFLISTTQVV